jgi:HAD superfamily hydrolase (TIGR01490 family)
MNLTLFDLDGTLLATDSDHAFGEFLVRVGWVDAQTFKQRNDAFYADYLAQTLDVQAYVEFATSAWRDRDAGDLQAVQQQFMREVIEPALLPVARQTVRQHVEAGDRVALVTATNEVVTRPIAHAFGIEHLVATELERDAQGRVTGAIRGTPSFREGKIARVDAWLALTGHTRADFERVTFYSDSMNDLPLLERVSHPIATNPSPALAAVARERGWPVLQWFP